ncbi:MAG TPA: hypothetical protein VM933_01455 [Acidimicrobiales bacterium]|nr:hypothetical protein [Acidimicrobiales bacterium]
MATPATPTPTTGTTSPDWTVQVADTIESVVGSVRDKTAVPLETIARALVYGILLGTMGVTALVLTTIVAVRLLSLVLEVWAAYAIIGGLFTLLGLFLWRKRRAPNGPDRK